jgi:hypothetical protein
MKGGYVVMAQLIWFGRLRLISGSEVSGILDDSAGDSAGGGDEVGVYAVVERGVEQPDRCVRVEVPQRAPGMAKEPQMRELKVYFSNFSL